MAKKPILLQFADDMRRKAPIVLTPEMDPVRIGQRVTALRETLRMRKAQLADSIGLDRGSLTKIEKGDFGLDIAKAVNIAQLYGFGLDFIYRGDIDDVPPQLRPELAVNLVTAYAGRFAAEED